VNDPEIEAFTDCLRKEGIIKSAIVSLTPLTGGVSSEIYRVDDGPDVFVVKRALAKLKVAADWHADTSRNAFEQAYIQYVERICPSWVPQIRQPQSDAGHFAMEFLDGFSNWKEDMLGGVFAPQIAAAAGEILGRIHAVSWDDPEVARDFDAIENFDQLRIDPYLRATALKHPTLAPPLLAEANRLRQSRQCLMHGDYSPKNMLHRNGRLVILDCEVACHGDAAFDLAFLLNHLMLKALYHAPLKTNLPVLFEAAQQSYTQALGARAPSVLEATARLLPMLLLARVDGKSPVEYLNADKQERVRQFAQPFILNRPSELQALALAWYKNVHP
jgi:aminoglycoside phosphotransferase (APT) family kinase protein